MAIIAAFCVSVAELLVGKQIFENHREYIAGALVVCGVAAWFFGRMLVAGSKDKEDETPEGETSNRFILFDLRYWGPMLLALGIITLFIRPLKQKVEYTALAATPPPPPPKKVVPKPPEPEPVVVKIPAVFPKLKMQGVIFRETRPFAIINGQSYTVGDRLGDVLVKSIDRASVILELQGELQVLTLN